MDNGRAAAVVGRLRRHFNPRSFIGGAVIAVLLIAVLSTYPATRSTVNIGPRSTPHSGEGRCRFPAIFNFGDSNSDTGGKSAAFHRLPFPNGATFFGKPSGRYCDGKVVLDFIAERLGLPYLSAYLDSIGADYRHGANFATGGSTIEPLDTRIFQGGFSPISLDLQLLQFEQFAARTIELHREGSLYSKSKLPMPDDIATALYTLDIGQNDIHSALGSMANNQVLELIPNITSQFGRAVEKLYQLGGRAFWIHNTGPIGCLPYSIIHYPPEPNNVDRLGCVDSYNKISQEFNRQLKEQVSKLRVQLPYAKLNYIDIYSAKYTLISEAKKHGFLDPFMFCCGHYGDYRLQCGKKAVVNGTEILGTACDDPQRVISWDAIHYSHAANKWVADRIVDGSLSDIQVPLAKSCPGS